MRRVWGGLLWASPGQVDAGLASLATFAAGLFSVRELEPIHLATYALLFSAFQVANQVSMELVFVPSQVLAVDQSLHVRLGMVRHSVAKGSKVAVLAAVLVPLGAFPIFGDLTTSDLATMAGTAAFLAFVSPIQDHMRSMFHISKRSWLAAPMSAIHFLTTAVCLAVGLYTDPLWAPFGALAIGNVASLGFAAVATGRIAPGIFPRPSQIEMFAMGKWLLFTGFARTASSYVARVLLNAIVGITALGHVEAARVVAQPINVLALGLMAQVGPRLTQASSSRHRGEATRWRRRFSLLLAAIALPYALLTATSWPTNPLASITPRAYQATGLTAAMLIAVITTCVLRPLRAELLGIRLQRKIASVSAISSLIEILVVFAGGLLGSFVIPLGIFFGGIAAAVAYSRILNRSYRGLE